MVVVVLLLVLLVVLDEMQISSTSALDPTTLLLLFSPFSFALQLRRCSYGDRVCMYGLLFRWRFSAS